MKRILVILLALLVSSCTSKQINKATQGALAGGVVGAGTGAIIGSQTGHAGPGIAIGAGLGALSGAIVGNELDKQDQANEALAGQNTRNQELLDENRRLIEELRSRGADARSSNRGVVVNLPDILFEFDSYVLTREAHRTLEEIADVLRGVKGRSISVEGHTDSIGTVSYNKRLSQGRARSVSDKLSRSGIPRGQMRTVGYGEGSPIATNNSDAGRARNRRVEVIIEN